MHTKTLFATALLHPAQFISLVKATVNTLIVLGSMSGFFTNLYNDLTAFALAMATFFFGWPAPFYMTANHNHNHPAQARIAHNVSLRGCALPLLAPTIP